MKRRHFLTASGIALASLTSVSYKVISGIVETKEAQLDANSIYVARPGEIVHLPKKPKHGDEIYIVTDSTSVKIPSKIRSTVHNLMGSSEDLELDVISNIRLVYQSGSGWSLG